MFRGAATFVAACLLVLAGLAPGGSVAAAAPTELFFSEYIEGSSNNKALEIYNGTGAAIDLAAGGYSVQMCFNGNASCGLTIALTGTVAAGDVYVIAQASASPTILAQADQTNGSGWFNGDDAVLLRRGTAVIDSIGQQGFDPGSEWGTGLASTADNTLRRKASVAAGDANASNAFDPAAEWDGYAQDTFDGLGTHSSDAAPAVSATSPAAGASGVAVNTNVTVTFSEPVDVAGTWATLTCATSGGHALAVSGGPSTFTLDPTTDLAPAETCTVTVLASQVTDQDAADPPDPMIADHTFTFSTGDACTQPATKIHAIQGSGTATGMSGATVTVQGVVVGDYQATGQFSGYYVQEEDADADGDPATSEGIFVFNTSFPVAAGDVVRITGRAGEFGGLTQLSSLASRVVCGTGASVTPTSVTLPVASVSVFERYEGMLVTFAQTLTATETFTLGRFGEVRLSADGRLYTPTAVVSPGAAAIAQADLNKRRSFVLDDGNNQQNIDPTIHPVGGLSASNTLRSGYTTTGLVGVFDERFGAYRLQPVGPVPFTASNPRTAAPAAASGNTKVASFNVLNYFNGDGLGGGFPTSRGAESLTEFARQRAKIVSAIAAMDADVVGLMEIENDATGNSALEDLVAGLNDATAAGTYAFIDTGIIGTDAIKVALIYKPATVTPVGAHAIIDSSVDPRFIDRANRPSIAQTFERNTTAARVTVVVNHLKSKGSSCDSATAPYNDPDVGDGQGNCNRTRTSAAAALADWLATDPTDSGDPDVLIIGDLNSYTFEDPIATLEAAGYTNLVRSFGGPSAYSYVFNGEAGYLDHALANAALASQVKAVTEWHINADEPIALDYNLNFKSANHRTTLYAPDAYRSSDHDPVVVTLDLLDTTPPVITFVGNAGTYTVDQTVAITCIATDDGTGVASITCDGGSGPAWSFGVGTHTVTATATDNAGNTATATTTFTVTADASSLCAVTETLVGHPGIVSSLCQKLRAADAAAQRGQTEAARNIRDAYISEVEAQRGKKIDDPDATVLVTIARTL